jgi:hypothetical protein
MKTHLIFIFFIFFLFENSNAQRAQWSFEFHGGLPYNIPSPLIIKQQNENVLRLNAKYYSEPMISPYYWVWRVSRFKDDKSWEFEAIHHKIYLKNTPPEVESFGISHGYNILTVNRSYSKTAFSKFSYILRLGAGVVLAHPENNIRDKRLSTENSAFGWGYYFSGPVLNVSVAKRFYLAKYLFANFELKFNPSVSKVPIADGHAIVWNLPLAFAFGLGVDFTKEKK